MNFQLLIGIGVVYVVAELASSIVSRRALWLTRNNLVLPLRSVAELLWMRAVAKKKLAGVRRRGIDVIKGRPDEGTSFARPMLPQLSDRVQARRRVLLLGEPGAGKSTVLSVLAKRTARTGFWLWLMVWGGVLAGTALLGWLVDPAWFATVLFAPLFDRLVVRWPIPVMVELRRYEGGPFHDFLQEDIARHRAGSFFSRLVAYVCERRRAVWILDGFDEIALGFSSLATDEINRSKDGGWLSGNGSVVSSRQGFDAAKQLGLDESLFVWDLDDDGVKEMLSAFGVKKPDAFFEELEEAHLLGGRGMGRNPFWLRMIVDTELQDRNRARLTAEYFRRQLAEENLDEAERNQLVGQLARLALSMCGTGQQGARLAFAEDILGENADDVLDKAETAGILVMPDRTDRVEFTHVLVQEFFAAFDLRSKPEKALRHLTGFQWWGVLSFLSGLFPQPDKLVAGALGADPSGWRPYLAVALLQNIGSPSPEIRERVYEAFVNSLRAGLSDEHVLAAQKLASIAPDSLAALLGQQFQSEDPPVREGAVRILGAIGGNYALIVLMLYRALENLAIRQRASDVLVDIGEPAIEMLLAAVWDDSSGIVEEAADVLERIGEPAVEPILESLEEHEGPPKTSVLDLLGWLGDERAIEPLVEALTAKEQSDRVREHAARALERLGSPAVEPLIEAAKHHIVRVRVYALRALGHVGDGRAVEIITLASRDTEDDIRAEAARALGLIGGDERVAESLMFMLRNKTIREGVRAVAAEALGWMRTDDVVKLLIDHLSDKHEIVRMRVATSLGRVQDSRVVKPLLTPLLNEDESEEVRTAAADALGVIGQTAVPPLLSGLRNKNAQLRSRCAMALGRFPDERAVEPLIASLSDPDESVQSEACSALGIIGDARALKPLLQTLVATDKRSGQVRARAARALGRIGDVRVMKYLGDALSDEDAQVREGVVNGLGELRDNRALKPVLQMLKDPSHQVRWEATEALGEIADENATAWLVKVIQNPNEHEKVRLGAGHALGSIGDRRAVPALLALLDDPVVEARRGAVEGLGQIGAVEAIEPLIGKMRDEHFWVRADAAEALGRFGDRRAVEPIIAELEDTSFWVRAEGSKTLGLLGDLRAVKPLIKALGDRKDLVRQRAAEALGSLANPWALKPLMERLRDSHDNVRAAAADALGAVADPRAVKPLLKLLERETDLVRTAAIRSMAKLADTSVIPHLEPLVGDQRHPLVAQAAREAITALGGTLPYDDNQTENMAFVDTSVGA